ncbi:hypothetical protein [Bdellovibrio bacteriovorus]|uniref:hypothetical protein n=1 Tax=Bdellovibrio bacteriovorus TaxID=959 RepID=UPI003AA7EB63
MQTKAILSFILATLMTVQSFGAATIFRNDRTILGNPTTGAHKDIEFNVGSGDENPRIRANTSTGVLEFTNDGVNFSDIGSGAGGGGGINLLKNGGFESGLNGWTHSGGTLDLVDPTSPLYVLGKKTGAFEATAAGHSFDTELVDIPPALQGKLCSFTGLYSGNSNGNLKIQVLDQTGALVSGFVEKALEPASGSDVLAFVQTFTCPSSGKIKGRVVSTAAAGPIGPDQFHLGEAVRLYTYGGRSIGEVFYTAADACPVGSEDANGDAVLIATYPHAFYKIGNRHGDGTTHGDGSGSGFAAGTAFNKADVRGRFIRGFAGTSTVDPDKGSRTAQAVGGASGNNVGSIQLQATRKNGLSLNDPGHAHTTGGRYMTIDGGTAYNPQGGGGTYYYRTDVSANTTGITINNGDNETRPANIGLRACQQLVGDIVPVLQTGEATQYAGTIYAWAGPMCPGTDLPADGRAALRTEFPDMYQNIGLSWGDGTKTPTGAASGIAAGQGFNFPDGRGLVLRGVDGGAGRDPNAATRTALITGGGGATGSNVGTFQDQATRKNGLALSDPGHTHSYQSYSANFSIANNYADPSANGFMQSTNANVASYATRINGNTTGISLGAGDSETRMRNVNVLYCVTTRTAKLGAVVPYSVVSKDQPARTVINTVVSRTADYTASLDEETIIVDTTTGNKTLSLPSASLSKGKKFHILNSGTANQLIVDPSASETVCGRPTIRVNSGGSVKDEITLQSDGTKWEGLHGSCLLSFSSAHDINGAPVLKSLNVLNGTCGFSSGSSACVFYTDVFSSTPICQVTTNSATGTASQARITAAATTGVTIYSESSAGAHNLPYNLSCDGPR